ncbi:MAG: M48 family metalloprotease [Candidatus Eiseniibacteriota bacterium]
MRSTVLPTALAAVLLLLPAGLARAADSNVKLDGYLEFRKADYLIVDGQRVKATSSTKLKLSGEAKNPATIPLGYAMKVKGTRDAKGTVLATEIEAKPNVVESSEARLLAGTSMAESTWVAAGKIVETGEDGKEKSMGALLDSGPEVDRVRRIVDRVMPPYIERSDVRVYVVENKEWNAMAMANYSIYVFSGILNDLNDDELALVLGHEIAHATNEHSRRQMSKSSLSQMAGQLAVLGASKIKSGTVRTIAQQATSLGYSAFNNSYSRDYEDQADRVGMRYAYEGGYDEKTGPELWKKFASKYGDMPKIQNYFYGNHSTSGDRAKNLEREIQLNYTSTLDPPLRAGKAATTTKATTTTTKSATTKSETTKSATTK